ASGGEKGRPLRLRPVEHGVEDLAHVLPALRGHGETLAPRVRRAFAASAVAAAILIPGNASADSPSSEAAPGHNGWVTLGAGGKRRGSSRRGVPQALGLPAR